tara:strand:- start:1980 stop:2609 length:630 start_codon:yes stop_codon:yes gene_type:complete
VAKQTSQLIIVQTKQWGEKKGRCYLFERQVDNFKYIRSFKVVLGRNGMKWGEGLHRMLDSNIKQEGDGASPAGIFLLGDAFGNEAESLSGNWPYIKTSEDDLFIDDSKSQYYNTWVNKQEVQKDWDSHEVMLREDGLYNQGLIIKHNMAPTKPDFGSAIFFHIWRNKNIGTAGCTASKKQNITGLLNWIKKDSNPLLIQLPQSYLTTIL